MKDECICVIVCVGAGRDGGDDDRGRVAQVSGKEGGRTNPGKAATVRIFGNQQSLHYTSTGAAI